MSHPVEKLWKKFEASFYKVNPYLNRLAAQLEASRQWKILRKSSDYPANVQKQIEAQEAKFSQKSNKLLHLWVNLANVKVSSITSIYFRKTLSRLHRPIKCCHLQTSIYGHRLAHQFLPAQVSFQALLFCRMSYKW